MKKALTQVLFAVAMAGLAVLPAHAAGALTPIDFDGDGRSDVLWRNAATGENYVYFMNGKTIAREGFFDSVPDQSWKIVGVGDFNGDGRSDILWRNSSTGENYVYLMSGLSIASGGYLPTVADQNWQIAGVGDFNGDRKTDILWRNASSGENYIYPMNGLAILSTQGYIPTVADKNWQVVAVADFNGDGTADIFWRNLSTGETYLYPMSGLTILGGAGYVRTVNDPRWRIVATGDYDGDGRADLLWRNLSSGENYLYPMDGTTVKATEGYISLVADLTWRPIATFAATIATLAWDKVTAPNLSGYRIYYGTVPGTYLQARGQGLSAGNATAYTVTGLKRGFRYYFAVTALDSSGNESPYSSEVFKDIQ